MIDKTVESLREAVDGIADGSTVMVGGFGRAGQPVELIDALIDQGAGDLTLVSNNAGNGYVGLAALLERGRVRKVICSFPRQQDSWVFDRLYRAGEVELELVPQGNLAERIRAAGAGIGAFFSPTAISTHLAAGKERRTIDGRDYLLEYPIKADVALVGGYRADRWGNVIYRKTARNFAPIMATAATTSIVQVDEIVALGNIDPETVATPGIYVDRVVAVGERPWLENGEFSGGVHADGTPLEPPRDSTERTSASATGSAPGEQAASALAPAVAARTVSAVSAVSTETAPTARATTVTAPTAPAPTVPARALSAVVTPTVSTETALIAQVSTGAEEVAR